MGKILPVGIHPLSIQHPLYTSCLTVENLLETRGCPVAVLSSEYERNPHLHKPGVLLRLENLRQGISPKHGMPAFPVWNA